MKTKTILAALMVASFAFGAGASSITIDSVVQRWPWNNKVDITYTIEGGQDLKLKSYARIIFTATIDGTPYMIDGRSIGADASDGQHTATWIPPTSLRVKSLDCTMTAQLLSAEIPSGNDYMIIDLETGEVTYEGRYADATGATDLTPSTNRYNTATYKSDKMVLKRIPRWADHATLPNADKLSGLTGYFVGNNDWANNKPVKYWDTKHDYYIGVFECTYAQYVKLGLAGDKGYTDANLKALGLVSDTTLVPAVKCKWNDLRGTSVPTDAITPNATGGFFQRLNSKTMTFSNITGFDLPTEIMHEIAQRAGKDAHYYWGEIDNYVVKSTTNNTMPLEVGSKLPNFWGLYDMAGNAAELIRDDTSQSNLHDATDPFVPAYNSSSDYAYKRYTCFRGGSSNNSTVQDFSSAKRGSGTQGAYRDSAYTYVGFRVSIVMD